MLTPKTTLDSFPTGLHGRMVEREWTITKLRPELEVQGFANGRLAGAPVDRGDDEPGERRDCHSPKYFRAIWMPSSYIFWKFSRYCSPRFVLREKNSMTWAIGVRGGRSSASMRVVEPTSIRPSRS